MGNRVLLVEDQDELRGQLVALLRRHDYTVEACADGMEGLYLAQK